MRERKTVLVIEDEPDIQELLEFNLHKQGFNVLVAGDGETGLTSAVENTNRT